MPATHPPATRSTPSATRTGARSSSCSARREPVGPEIADELPISRPAVSRHLRLLKEAGLVVEEPRGTRRLYRLHDEGVEAVRAYLAEVWGEAAARFRLVAENTDRARRAVIEPIRLSFEVACPAAARFESGRRARRPGGRPATRVSGEPGLEVVLRAAGRRPDLRAHRAGRGVRLGRGPRLGAAAPARLPVAPARRPGRRDRGRDRVHRRRPRTDVVAIEHRGWERLGSLGHRGAMPTAPAGPACSRTSWRTAAGPAPRVRDRRFRLNRLDRRAGGDRGSAPSVRDNRAPVPPLTTCPAAAAGRPGSSPTTAWCRSGRRATPTSGSRTGRHRGPTSCAGSPAAPGS